MSATKELTFRSTLNILLNYSISLVIWSCLFGINESKVLAGRTISDPIPAPPTPPDDCSDPPLSEIYCDINHHTFMKSLIAFIFLFLAVSFLGCQDSRDDLNNSESDFYKTIGEEIPFQTGIDWIEFYKAQYHDNGRVNILTNYSVSESQLQALLGSVSGLVGVAFHYGTDSWGTRHIILIPVETSLTLWSSIQGRIYVDANTGNQISQSTAQAWATSYKNAHSSGIWFHFFGAHIFDEIQALPFFDSIDIEPGIDLLNLTPELLLIVWNDGLLFGRTRDEGGKMYDASNPCPPCVIQ